ncbi:ImuA family protein [Acidiphilium sp. JA12-A1]|uniref:ImuA family protein n=1 Tax=Acidiphilium sp. JA12-A1 TaxID=1464546 RepID=UPI000461DB73|nr:hypothetical protein [Acidiphilium sp. JA12-A1]KDM68299.1 hypothetical protein ACIDI_10c00070 [Acidiphilium sp. JA12-A1]
MTSVALFSGLQSPEIRPGTVHEIAGDQSIVSFAALLLGRTRGAPICWVGSSIDLYPPGLAGLALDPGRLVMAEAEREEDRLALLETALAGGLHAAGPMTRISRLAVRRLALAARRGQAVGLVLNMGKASDSNAFATRWRIGAEPSGPDGARRWRAELLHAHGVPPGSFGLELGHDGATYAFDLAGGGTARQQPLRRAG